MKTDQVWHMPKQLAVEFAVVARRLPIWCRWWPRTWWPDRLLSFVILRWGIPTSDLDDGRRR
jgi:hypothetical protein